MEEEDEIISGLIFDSKTGEIITSGEEAIEVFLSLKNPDEYTYVETEQFFPSELRPFMKSAKVRVGYGLAVRHMRKAGIL